MSNTYRQFKASLSFSLGKNPRVENCREDFRRFIPEPYQGVIIISADFELAWAWRYDKLNPDPLNNSLSLARRERENIPYLISLSEQYNIPVTWGTVGHLFLSNCNTSELPHPEILRLPHFENNWWNFKTGDWFSNDPGSSLESSPEWYAPDLVKQILHSKVKHEIACHSFSHISCADGVCSPEVLQSELKASQAAADPFDIKLESFIFPGHTMGNYETIRKTGYSSIRTNFTNTLGYPVIHKNGLWEHKATMELCYNKLFTIEENLKRYNTVINKCIKNHQVCNLWFHPSFDDINTETLLPQVFKELQSENQKLWITTMKQYTDWLNIRKHEIS